MTEKEERNSPDKNANNTQTDDMVRNLVLLHEMKTDSGE